MTIAYSSIVATGGCGFVKLLIRWKGSIYKLLWKELLIFIVLYYSLNFIYRFGLTADQKPAFEQVAVYCESFNNLIPMPFLLGFYVTIVCTRWWDQFKSIPWPDRTALFVTALIHGRVEKRPRMMRRTIMRYLVLSFTMTLSEISVSVKKRFPTLERMKDAGLILDEELEILEGMGNQHSKSRTGAQLDEELEILEGNQHSKSRIAGGQKKMCSCCYPPSSSCSSKKKMNDHSKYFVPLVWATSLVTKAREEDLIKDDFAVKTIIDEINSFRSDLGMLNNFDGVNIPMVYTQVVTLAVYCYFLSCLMGRQFLDPTKGNCNANYRPDMYFPFFTLLQFSFYTGWLKVAATLINPLGEDDDDFDINSTIDRNLQVSYMIVDGMPEKYPTLIPDADYKESPLESDHGSAEDSTFI